jgi:hypothetical protein
MASPNLSSNSSPSKALVLAELRVAAAQARLIQHEIEAIGLALAEGLLTPAMALSRLREAGCVPRCDWSPGDTIE